MLGTYTAIMSVGVGTVAGSLTIADGIEISVMDAHTYILGRR